MKIYEPSFFVRHTQAVVALSIVIGIITFILSAMSWRKLTRQRSARAKERRLQMISVQSTSNIHMNMGHALAHDGKKRR